MYLRAMVFVVLGIFLLNFFQNIYGEESSLDLYILFMDWQRNIEKIKDKQQTLDKQIEVALSIPQIESNVEETQEDLKKLNQEMYDLENKIDQKIKDRSSESYKEYWDMIKRFHRKTGADVMTYWDSEKDISTRTTWDDIRDNPHMFRNIYYFLNNAPFPKNLYGAILFTKVPPKGIKSPMSYKKIECRAQIFSNEPCRTQEADFPKYVLYVDPSLSYENMIKMYEERIAMPMTLEIGEKGREKLSQMNESEECGIPAPRIPREERSLQDLVNDEAANFVYSVPDINWLRQEIRFKLDEKIREIKASSDNTDEEKERLLKNIGNFIVRFEMDKMGDYSYFSSTPEGILRFRFSGMSIDFPQIPTKKSE